MAFQYKRLILEVLLPQLYEVDNLDLFGLLRCACREFRDKLPFVDMEYIGIRKNCCRLRGLELGSEWEIRRRLLDLRVLLGWCEGSSAPGLRLLRACAPIIDRLLVVHSGALAPRGVLLEGAELVMELSRDVAAVGRSISARHFELRRELRRLLPGARNLTGSCRLNVSQGHCGGG